jgi:hypothetical protein
MRLTDHDPGRGLIRHQETFMQIKTVTKMAGLALGATLCVGMANAVTITIEPDNYVGVIGNVAPGAQLSTFRSDGLGGFVFHPVLSVSGGTWAPTGVRVFGHRTTSPSEPPNHWDNLATAYSCESGGACGDKFYVFRVDFDRPTSRASVLTTVRGDMAQDGMELHAYNAAGLRIQRCRMGPWNNATIATGVVASPRYVVPAPAIGDVCGGTVSVKNCGIAGPLPGGCDYVIRLNVRRVASDISYIQFGGANPTGSFSPVDKLQYWLP